MVKANFRGRRLSEVMPGAEAHWLEMPARVVDTAEPERAELWAEGLGQWFDVGIRRSAPTGRRSSSAT
jgi:hypothetical protein